MSDGVPVTIIPRARSVSLPQPATGRTRSPVPSGYGVQEQCLPFVAASALGYLIPSPIGFGLCVPAEAPEGCRMFRSPLDVEDGAGQFADPRVFYVMDDAELRFAGNAYQLEGIPVDGSAETVEPGLSFFDRPDQQHLFKLHLPYIWRTPEGVDTLFLPLVNRPSNGVGVQCGLVETDWYPSPVNLILAKPGGAVHFRAGEPVAQAVPMARGLRRAPLQIAAAHSKLSRETRKALAEWDKLHAADRGAYKVLVRGIQQDQE